MSKGWISVHRKLRDNPIWADPNYLKLWLYCLFEASHKDREQLVGNKIVQLKRGQFITGRHSLGDDLNHGMKPKQKLNNLTWFRYLKNLEEFGMLNINSNNKYSVVTIVKYGEYQGQGEEVEHQDEQVLNNNCSTTEQQLFTNNNVNNYNNVNKSSSIYENSPFEFYQQNFGVLKPFVSESIGMWCDDLSDEIVIAAMKLAVKRGGNTFSYVEPILKEWLSNNLLKIEDVRSYEEHKKVRKAGPYDNKNNRRGNGQASETSKGESITGGQTGWINRGRREA